MQVGDSVVLTNRAGEKIIGTIAVVLPNDEAMIDTAPDVRYGPMKEGEGEWTFTIVDSQD